jgi:hypothetical protein
MFYDAVQLTPLHSLAEPWSTMLQQHSCDLALQRHAPAAASANGESLLRGTGEQRSGKQGML